ncbi:MAG: PRC-barrel domain-containing protein [Anaerolineae bacterium]|nr:PRC-barrel domain-containing protein [Anaerolineae bacterium]
MTTVRRISLLLGILVLSLGLLAACGGNDEDNDVGLNNNDGFGNEDAGFGNVDVGADADVDVDAEIEPTPLAPELTVTEAVTAEVEATAVPEPTEMPEPEVEATAAVTTTEEVTTTEDITDTADAETGAIAGSFLVRATTLFDLDLSDEVDEDAGELTDFLFDEEGKIHYAILEVDADGEGEIVAVPWDSLDVAAISTDAAGEYDYGLTWVDDLDAVSASIESDLWTEDSIVIDADAFGLDVEMDATTANLFRASAFIDEGLFDTAEGDVVNADGVDVGEIEDLLIDVEAGTVVYALVDVGGFLGVGERNLVLPWEQLTFDATAENFSTDVDEATLEEAPEFDADEAFADSEVRMDESIRSELDAYWDIDVDVDDD